MLIFDGRGGIAGAFVAAGVATAGFFASAAYETPQITVKQKSTAKITTTAFLFITPPFLFI